MKSALQYCLNDLQAVIKIFKNVIHNGLNNVDIKSDVDRFMHSACFNLYSQMATFIIITKTKTTYEIAPFGVLARAAYESFLLFHYMVVAPKNVEELNMRLDYFNLMMYCNAIKFQDDVQFNNIDTVKKLKKITQDRLFKNRSWIALKAWEKKEYTKRFTDNNSNGKMQSWKNMRQCAGLPKHYDFFYHYVCDIAHSGPLNLNMNIVMLSSIDERIGIVIELIQRLICLCGYAIQNYISTNLNMLHANTHNISQSNHFILKYENLLINP